MELTKKEAIALYAILGNVLALDNPTERIYNELENYIKKIGLWDKFEFDFGMIFIDKKNAIGFHKDRLEKLCD